MTLLSLCLKSRLCYNLIMMLLQIRHIKLKESIMSNSTYHAVLFLFYQRGKRT